MKVGVVDIGTNSMRLLVTDGHVEDGRWVEVTGLGRGLDVEGVLAEDAIERTLTVLRRFGELMDGADVASRAAIATSATRDASNREVFLDAAEQALGVRPRVISGAEEAAYAYQGASRWRPADEDVLVSDIGGGSTEFVSASVSVSVDIGSVRLTDRHLTTRPASSEDLERAFSAVWGLFADVPQAESVVGIAGTWTSLAAMAQGLSHYDREAVHGYGLSARALAGLIVALAGMSIEETEAIPSLDPKRAPVILGGAIIAGGVLDATGAASATVSEHDTLDGVAMELLALP